ncbi:enoyl-CoA hydratase/isomerase family protein [Actinosynnema sp. CA-248983]
MIEWDVVDGVGVVAMAHGKVNALDLELCREIRRVMGELDGVRALVLTGAGRVFSAGVDLKRVVDGGGAYVAEFVPALTAAFRAVFDVDKPVVAAVNGHAIAGGCVLAAACDHRVMAGGTIGLPEPRVGVPFPHAALEIVRFAVGPVVARRVVFDGANYEPAVALGMGLVDELCEPDALRDRAVAVAHEWVDRIPADAFRHTKAQLRAELNARLDRLSDAAAVDLWTKAATDGRIQDFLDRTVGGGARS